MGNGLNNIRKIKRKKFNRVGDTNKMKLMNKKGFEDFTSLFFALAVLFGLAVFFIILSYSYSQIEPRMNTALTSTNFSNTEVNQTDLLNKTGNTLTRFNPLFPLLLIGVFAFVMVTALLGRSHPAFLFIGLIVLGVALILAAIYSNVYESITESSNFSSTESDFGIMSLFLDNLPVIIVILFVGIGVILYSKSGGAQGM